MAIKKKEYHKIVKHATSINHYYYEYKYSEPISTKHIRNNENIPEWYRCTDKERHVFYEIMEKRWTEYTGEIKKAGRPVGSKDSYQRIRHKKED